MKTKTLILNLALLAALPVAANEATLRYDLSGEMQLSMNQEIFAGGRSEAIATRNLSMTVDMGDGPEAHSQAVKLATITASYTAHGMKQRLPTSQLTGDEFTLLGDGRSFTSQEGGDEVPLGTITDGGIRPPELLAGLLPELPEEAVSVGTTWTTDRSILSLTGWAWAGGEMQNHHEITDIQQSSGHTIINVRTHGKTTIAAADGHNGFLGEGTLDQSVDWAFDADSGQLLSLSIEQESSGTNQLPQGEIPVRQIARFELSAVN